MVEFEVNANVSYSNAKPIANFGAEKDDLDATVDFSRAGETKKRPVILPT